MLAIEDIKSLATLIILLQLALQGWVVVETVRRPRNTRSIALFVAAGALAVRGVAILTGIETPDILEEVAVLIVSAALWAARPSPKAPDFNISEVDHALMENSPNPIMIKRASGEYIYVNPSFEVAFERKSADMLGRTSKDIWEHALSEAAGSVRLKRLLTPSYPYPTFCR